MGRGRAGMPESRPPTQPLGHTHQRPKYLLRPALPSIALEISVAHRSRGQDKNGASTAEGSMPSAYLFKLEVKPLLIKYFSDTFLGSRCHLNIASAKACAHVSHEFCPVLLPACSFSPYPQNQARLRADPPHSTLWVQTTALPPPLLSSHPKVHCRGSGVIRAGSGVLPIRNMV